MRIFFFATDIHASDRSWMKFVNAAAFYDAQILIMGGDFTGKAVVPLIEKARGEVDADIFGRHVTVSESELPALEKELAVAHSLLCLRNQFTPPLTRRSEVAKS